MKDNRIVFQMVPRFAGFRTVGDQQYSFNFKQSTENSRGCCFLQQKYQLVIFNTPSQIFSSAWFVKTIFNFFCDYYNVELPKI